MSFKDIIKRISESKKEKKELLEKMDTQMRIQMMLEERKKSSNERELERYLNEEREKMIKGRLEYMRKKRDRDINFNHNPLSVKNITNHTEWEVLKEKNMFNNNRCMFSDIPFIHKNNDSLLKSNIKLMT